MIETCAAANGAKTVAPNRLIDSAKLRYALMLPTSTSHQRRYQVPGALPAKGPANALAIWIALLIITTGGVAKAQEALPDTAPFRMALSIGTFAEVNANDAQAAVMAWAKTIVAERGIVIEVETKIFEKIEELAEALESRQVDAAAVLAVEFMGIPTKPDSVFLSKKNNSVTERYVLLVHRDSGIDAVDKLLGHKLLQHNNPRTSLAAAWLDTLLANHSLGFPEEFFESTTRIDNASKAILRVFFRQSDACIVTATVFDIVSELNPQLRKKLKVIAESPEVIPTLFFFSPGYTAEAKSELESALVALHKSPAGQQVLTIFQGDRMEKHPISCLERSRELVEKADRLRRNRGYREKHHLSLVNDNAKN